MNEAELVEVVGADGTVERLVTRAEMRRDNLRHRSVGVVMRRPTDRAVLVHRRAGWKDVWPGAWDLAFGGVCGVGEPYATSAIRELAEEAGVTVGESSLRRLGGGRFEDADVAAVTEFFEVEHDGPFTFADGEVEEVSWVAFEILRRWIDFNDVVPDSVAIALPLLRP